MKFATLICASAVIVLGTAGAALAAGTPIGTAPGTTEADCINGGGTVVTDDQGNKVCRPRPGRQAAPVGREPTN